MGIVSKQASIASFLSYVGVIIGFINVTLLMNHLFTKEEFGLREVLLNVAVFSSQIAHLGTYRSLVKFFPFFNQQGKGDNGLLMIGLLIPFVGFIVFTLLIVIFKAQILSLYIEKSPLFVEYFWFCIPLFFLMMYNNVLDSYLQSRAKTAYSVFLKSIFNRLVVTGLLLLYYINWIDFYGFIVYFIASYLLNILLFFIYLHFRKELCFKINTQLFNRRVRKVYLNYSAFSIFSGASSVLVNKMDAIMIAALLGLQFNAIYANAVYLCILIAIPGDAIARIALPLVSRSWKMKRLDEIELLYKKTSVTQFLLGGCIFVLMWASIDNFFALQQDGYEAGKYVFAILALSKLVNMIFGVNGQIISVSKYYRFDTTTALLLGLLTVVTNYIFIPIWEIEGAATATALSIIIFNLIRFSFVRLKFNIQPFSWNTLKALCVLGFALLVNGYLPTLENIYSDTLFRSSILTIILGAASYLLKISEDINAFIDKHILMLRKNLS